MTELHINVNGTDHSLRVPPRSTLAEVLRSVLGLTGTHLGCEQGACGACTVLLNGRPIRSCLVFGVQVDGSRLTTIEGVASDESAQPLFEAFLACRGFQCGFCTPGMIVSLYAALLAPGDAPDVAIDDALDGHICRCTGYTAVREAAQSARMRMQ